MLTLTENASTIVTSLVAQVAEDGKAESAGLRFSHDGASPGATGVTPVQEPQPGDQVVGDGGATVYLEEAAAAALTDSVLDATVDPEGAVQFSLAPQGGAAGA